MLRGSIRSLTAHATEHASLGSASPNVIGATKWFGSVQNAKSYNDTGTFSAVTYPTYGGGYKMEAEAPFTAVQLVYINRSPNQVVFKSLVGVTETADHSIAASAFHPVIGGVTYNAVRTAGSVNGWVAATASGAATVTVAAASAAQQVAVGDWMPLSSIDRADGGTRPLFLNRNQISQADGSGDFCTYSNGPIAAMRAPIAAARNRIIQLFTGAAMVNTPASVNGSLGTVSFEVFPRFRYSVPSKDVMCVGDSTFQMESLGLQGIITSWGWRGCADASSPSYVFSYMNCGQAGKTYTEYAAAMQALFSAGVIPSVLVIAPLSVNDYSSAPNNLPAYIETAKANAANALSLANQYKIRHVCFVPLLPYNSLTLANDNLRKGYNTWLRTFAATMRCGYLDFSAIGDGASPEKFVVAYNASAGHQVVILTVAPTAATATNYVAGTTYTATITINGTACAISFLGSAAATYGDLISVLNAQINTGMGTSATVYASLVGESLVIQSATTGSGSTVAITAGTAFASPLNGFASVSTAFAGSADGIHENELAADTVMAPALTAYLKSIAY